MGFENLSKKFLTTAEMLKHDDDYQKRIADFEERYKDSFRSGNIEHSGIPDGFKNKSFSNYDCVSEEQRSNKVFMQNFAHESKIKVVCLIGVALAGKTHLASGLLHEVQGKYCTMNGLAELRQKKIKSENDTQHLQSLKDCNVLVIDSVTAATIQKAGQEILYQTLDERMNAGKLTVIIFTCTDSDSRKQSIEFANAIGADSFNKINKNDEVKVLRFTKQFSS